MNTQLLTPCSATLKPSHGQGEKRKLNISEPLQSVHFSGKQNQELRRSKDVAEDRCPSELKRLFSFFVERVPHSSVRGEAMPGFVSSPQGQGLCHSLPLCAVPRG